MDAIILFLILMTVGYFAGTRAEKKHYQSIEERERRLLHVPLLTLKNTGIDDDRVSRAELVYGSAVISVDYFKRFLAGLRKIFGGNIQSYESLLDRARREAVLRMVEAAPNASMIVNVRYETAPIGAKNNQKGVSCVEAMAYGTAVILKDAPEPQ